MSYHLDADDIDGRDLDPGVLRVALVLALRAAGLGRPAVGAIMGCSTATVSRQEQSAPAELREFVTALARSGSAFQACCELGWSEPILEARLAEPKFARAFRACTVAATIARRVTAPPPESTR